ncbi:SPOR domain-containing protein [Kangiella sp. TOML190]|uniref:SPOR domain-containing protein n=1 Tax=Kangiella sp. TOML190 TaxID=2931351 RepID=UPI00203E95E3|nr:SPOR domain-containing protein [Kangiella sp. TOML190]
MSFSADTSELPKKHQPIHVPESWQRLIAVIRHQLRPNHFIFIEAPHQAGKTTFASVLSKKLTLNEEISVSYQNLHPLSTTEQILGAIPDVDSFQSQIQLVILDDCMDVDPSQLERIISSNIDKYFVVLGEPELLDRIPRLQESRFTLPLFNKEDCHKLLNKQQHSIDPSLDIPSLESELIYFESRGFPGEVLRLGEQLQVKLKKKASSLKSYDLANRGVLSSLIIGLGVLIFLGYLLFAGGESQEQAIQSPKPLEQNTSEAESKTQVIDGGELPIPILKQSSSETAGASSEGQTEAEKEVEGGELVIESTQSAAIANNSFEVWIETRSPEHFTIQLFSHKSKQEAEAFKQELDLADSYVYPARVNGETHFRVIWGDYPNRARAQLAIQSLPQSIMQQKPWLRSFSSLAKELQQ